MSKINSAYTGLREDVLNLVENRPCKNLLDVGCSTGVTLRYCKDLQIVESAVGIEGNVLAASEAKKYADYVLVCDLDAFTAVSLHEYRFDLIFLADVLEHTKDPEKVLLEILKLSTSDASVIISLPNVQHWTAVFNLLVGTWPQRDRGLFDKTHLRWFTLSSIQSLANACGLKVDQIRRNMRITDFPGARINRLARFTNFLPVRSFFTYQYVVRLKLATSN